jgi:RNA polymerase sigma factor (sigma-70 family)
MCDEPTVFLVDDDAQVRDALKWLIESVDLKVELYDSAARFLEAFEPNRRGCLVLDVRMPGVSGLELQDQLVATKIGLPIIIITGHGDIQMCVRAFEAGAFAFLEKPVNHQVLLDRIQRAIQHDLEQRGSRSFDADDLEKLEKLTPREREVMDLIVAGKTMKQIAAELGISIPTCSKHRSAILEKIGADNDVELVRFVMAAGPDA